MSRNPTHLTLTDYFRYLCCNSVAQILFYSYLPFICDVYLKFEPQCICMEMWNLQKALLCQVTVRKIFCISWSNIWKNKIKSGCRWKRFVLSWDIFEKKIILDSFSDKGLKCSIKAKYLALCMVKMLLWQPNNYKLYESKFSGFKWCFKSMTFLRVGMDSTVVHY